MGTFLSLSGVIGRSSEEVLSCLQAYFDARGDVFEPLPGGVPGRGVAVIREESGNATILYPDDFTQWDDASKYLSSQLSAAAFSLHIHDGDLWMLVAFNHGEDAAWFNPLPHYWGNVTDEEVRKWSGNAIEIARLAKVQPASIEKYFVAWDVNDIETTGKAYVEDQSEFGVDWQLLDFMSKIGLPFPIADSGEIIGTTYRYQEKPRRPNRTSDSPSAEQMPRSEVARPPAPARPWWKFW